jgi:hypothetical protein
MSNLWLRCLWIRVAPDGSTPIPDYQSPKSRTFGASDRRINKRGFNFPAHRNLRVSEGVENLLR